MSAVHPSGIPGFAGCFLLLALALPIRAQDSLPPWEGGLTASLGQPSKLRTYAGASAGWDVRARHPDGPVTYGVLSLNHALGSAIAGAGAAVLEGYAGMRSARFDGGVRAMLEVPTLGVGAGVEYNLRDDYAGAVIALTHPVRRGGVLGSGSLLRAEWSPGAARAFRLSVLAPFGWPAAGETRPRSDRVHLPPRRDIRARPTPPDAARLEPILARMDQTVRQLEVLVVPRVDPHGSDARRALAPLVKQLQALAQRPEAAGRGVGTDATIRAYHRALEHAFSLAIQATPGAPDSVSEAGARLTASALEILRRHVLYPYDRWFGQWKTPPTLEGLATHARGNFARTVMEEVDEEQEPAVLYVFERLLAAVSELERRQRSEWEDSRLVWLPLQLGLRPEDHDTQAELDAIVESVAGLRFWDGNHAEYIINQEFQSQLIRSIHDTREYHVLWVHDFRGRNDAGEPDARSMQTVINAYLEALTTSAAKYDAQYRVPTFMIFIDQHYYDRNHARLWLDVLERPLDVEARLTARDGAAADSVRAAQARLRAAVAGSRLLQAEKRQYGEAWLRNLLKVHISVTNPADPSFSSEQILPLLGMPDNVIRDHRKIVFFDITEEHPYRGRALYTGMGVGEHYTSETWEDRALMLRGPAALSLKMQARMLLENQGLRGERVPWVLRPRPLVAGYADTVAAELERMRLEGQPAYRALELHNLTGFQEKQVSVVRAVLYSLMPPGAVIKVPDSLWGSGVFAALLTGSALRGCRVLFIAPSRAAAPSSGMPQMARAHELFTRLIVLQQELGPELDAAGGMLKTGIYNPGVGVGDVMARFENSYWNARRTPFLRRLFPVSDSVDTLLVRLKGRMPPAPTPAPTLRTGRTVMPKLHLKANFFASAEAWDSLVARVEMQGVLLAYLGSVLGPPLGPADPAAAAQNLALAAAQLEDAYRRTLTPAEAERVLYFALMGSANLDYRSMHMDGEASVLLSGWAGIVALIDFGLIANMSIWIDDLEMLDALLPPPNALERGLAWWLRFAL